MIKNNITFLKTLHQLQTEPITLLNKEIPLFNDALKNPLESKSYLT